MFRELFSLFQFNTIAILNGADFYRPEGFAIHILRTMYNYNKHHKLLVLSEIRCTFNDSHCKNATITKQCDCESYPGSECVLKCHSFYTLNYVIAISHSASKYKSQAEKRPILHRDKKNRFIVSAKIHRWTIFNLLLFTVIT